MNKKGLIKYVSIEVGLPPKIVGAVINSFLGTIISGVVVGVQIKIPGFGKFSKSKYTGRKCWNPVEKKAMVSNTVDIVRFEPGQPFKDAVRGK